MRNDIVAKGIVKKFGTTEAINGLSFTSNKGMNIILGPNGAGKSTLLRCLSGLYKPNKGKVTVLGADPYEDSTLKNRISFLADNYGLYDFMTVEQNLAFFGRFYGLNRNEAVEKASPMIKGLKLEPYIKTKVEALSRGTKQKAAFCRTILNDPEVLLLDEPTAFLDASASRFVREHLQKLANENKTIVFVTQKIDEVERFNSRVLVIRKGRMVRDTSTKELYNTILKNSQVSIRFARPVKERIVKTIKEVSSKDARDPTLITVRVNSYREIGSVIRRLADRGAYIVSVDYVEPEVEKLVFGEQK